MHWYLPATPVNEPAGQFVQVAPWMNFPAGQIVAQAEADTSLYVPEEQAVQEDAVLELNVPAGHVKQETAVAPPGEYVPAAQAL